MRCPRSRTLFITIASSRPRVNVSAGVRNAKAKFHTTIFRNDDRITEFEKMFEKLWKPTLTFHPCASSSPLFDTKKPVLPSAFHVCLVSRSVMHEHLLL